MASGKLSWGCCNENNEDEQYTTCTGNDCNLSYHLACLTSSGLNKNTKIPTNWKCPTCTNSGPKLSKQDSTPVRNVSNTRGSKRPALNSPESATVSSEEVRNIVQDVIKTEFSAMIKELKNNMVSIVNKEMVPLKQAMQDIHESMNFMNSRFEEIEVEQADAKTIMSELQAENVKMKAEIMELNQRLNNLEQHSRANNLEIQCVPENKQENLYTLINNLATTVGSTLQGSDIMNCTRIAKLRKENTRPRSIVVQLASPRVRNELLAAVISFNKANPQNKLNSEHLGLAGAKTAVYVTEHLTPANKALHAAARKKAKERGYVHVWVRDARIYARKTDDSDAIFIRNPDSVNKII